MTSTLTALVLILKKFVEGFELNFNPVTDGSTKNNVPMGLDRSRRHTWMVDCAWLRRTRESLTLFVYWLVGYQTLQAEFRRCRKQWVQHLPGIEYWSGIRLVHRMEKCYYCSPSVVFCQHLSRYQCRRLFWGEWCGKSLSATMTSLSGLDMRLWFFFFPPLSNIDNEWYYISLQIWHILPPLKKFHQF